MSKIKLHLDTRREKNTGTYPLKLYLYANGENKYYHTDLSFTKQEFESIWKREKEKVSPSFRPARIKLEAIIDRAQSILDSIEIFDFAKFESQFLGKEKNDADYFYDQLISDNLKHGRIGTMNWYKYSRNSLIEYFKDLRFEDITEKSILEYERWMEAKGRSRTTISMHLRALMSVFNKAINEGEIKKDDYPFGASKYRIKNSKKVKKALDLSEIKLLFNSNLVSKSQAKAKDFWFFSYFCNGININDIAYLRLKDVGIDTIHYERNKTRFKDVEQTIITIYQNEFTRMVISEYAVKRNKPDPNDLVFGVLDKRDNPVNAKKKIANFIRVINKNMKRLLKQLGINKDITSYWARHSFATLLIRKGKSISYVQEALGHSDAKTTQSYINSFQGEEKKEVAEGLYSDLI